MKVILHYVWPLLLLVIYIYIACSVYVGNLSFDCDEDSLNSFFTDAGHEPSSVRIIMRDGRPKG